MDKSNAVEKFNKANSLYESGDYEAALTLLEALEVQYPQKKNVLYARARCYAKLGEYEAAMDLCRTCVERWEAPPAQRLLDQLRNEEYLDDESSDLQKIDLELEAPLPGAFDVLPVWRKTMGERHPALLAIVIIGAAAIAWAVGIAWDRALPESNIPESDTEMRAELERNHIEARRMRIAREDGPSSRAGQLIPKEIWARTAVNGLPLWKPGKYRNIPCPDAYVNLPDGRVIPRTIDAYIPMAYQDHPQDLLPGVIINGASMNPGFLGLENWAEHNDAILVVINSVCNLRYKENWRAQDAALVIVRDTMRVDTAMGFAIGMSGGGATSWEMICRYPENFRGLVMMGISKGHNGCWIPSHVRVGYIHGRSDHNVNAIKRTIPMLRSSGNLVREQVVPGGHVLGPYQVREKMLTWMLEDVRNELAEWGNSDSF